MGEARNSNNFVPQFVESMGFRGTFGLVGSGFEGDGSAAEFAHVLFEAEDGGLIVEKCADGWGG